jgi:hypothetical protein
VIVEPARPTLTSSSRRSTVFADEGVPILKTPIQAPRANAYNERRVRTIRAECLEWTLIWNRRHAERVPSLYVEHYNTPRPHRG